MNLFVKMALIVLVLISLLGAIGCTSSVKMDSVRVTSCTNPIIFVVGGWGNSTANNMATISNVLNLILGETDVVSIEIKALKYEWQGQSVTVVTVEPVELSIDFKVELEK